MNVIARVITRSNLKQEAVSLREQPLLFFGQRRLILKHYVIAGSRHFVYFTYCKKYNKDRRSCKTTKYVNISEYLLKMKVYREINAK